MKLKRSIISEMTSLLEELSNNSVQPDLLVLSPRAYKELNIEAHKVQLGIRPTEIHTFCSPFGEVRILEGLQSDRIIVYKEIK